MKILISAIFFCLSVVYAFLQADCNSGGCNDMAKPLNERGAPYNVVAETRSRNAVLIRWTSRPYIDSLRLDRSTDGQSWQTVRDRFNPPNYVVDGEPYYWHGQYYQSQLAPGTEYYYRICAYYAQLPSGNQAIECSCPVIGVTAY